MTRYVDTMLEPGETLRYRTSISALIAYRGPTLVSMLTAWILFQANDWGDQRYDEAAIYAVLFCAVYFLYAWIQRVNTEIAVTDRRIIYKRGYIGLRTEELNMEAIESIAIRQLWYQSLLNYGYVYVHGSGGGWGGNGWAVDSPLALRATMTHSGGGHE